MKCCSSCPYQMLARQSFFHTKILSHLSRSTVGLCTCFCPFPTVLSSSAYILSRLSTGTLGCFSSTRPSGCKGSWPYRTTAQRTKTNMLQNPMLQGPPISTVIYSRDKLASAMHCERQHSDFNPSKTPSLAGSVTKITRSLSIIRLTLRKDML